MTQSDPANRTETRIVEIDKQQLRIAVGPGGHEKLPLLLLNGIGANLELLQPFVDALGDEIQTIRVDLPGTGASPAPTIPYRPSGLAKLQAKLLDELGYPVVDVLGISLGGAIAQQFAHQYPHRCRRLILVSTATGAIMVPGTPSVLLKMLTPRRYSNPAYMASIASELYGGRIRADPGLIKGHAGAMRTGGSLGYYWQLLGITGWTSIHWLHRLRQPTLILSGTDDPIVPPINARIMARLIPNAQLHVFDDGHLGLLTSADTLAPLIREFLTSQDGSTTQAGLNTAAAS